MSKLGRRIQRLRAKKGLSRRQLEIAAEIPHGVVSRLESERSDKRAWPSVPAAMRLAKVLGVSVDYLIGMYEEEDEEDSELEPASREPVPA
jgi:transcriptional regulator with XRE-family HTH domain